MAVDAIDSLDQDDLDDSLIGVKKIAGGGMQDSLLIRGVAFKKTFTYAGAEQQPKLFHDPLILSLNVELELKAEKDNAEVRVDAVADYQAIVDAEWEIIYRKLQAIEKRVQRLSSASSLSAILLPNGLLTETFSVPDGSLLLIYGG